MAIQELLFSMAIAITIVHDVVNAAATSINNNRNNNATVCRLI